MPARQTSTESAIDERPATRSQGPADDTTDKKRTAVQAGVNKNDPIPEKRSKSEGSETSTTERAKDGRRQGHQPHESIDEILKDEDYELVSERTNKYGNSTLIFLDKNSGYHATYPNVSHEHYKPGSRDVVKDDSRKSYSRRDDDDVKHGHVQGAVLHPETDKRLKENQDGKPYQAEAGKQSHKDTPSKTEAKDDSKDAKYEANRKDDSVQHGHTQGAVLHPETDMRLKENRDKKDRSYDTKHPEANKQSTKNGTGYENKDHSYDSVSQDDRYELVEEHENKNGASTLVYRNKDTDYHIVFPNVKKSDDDKSTTKDSKDANRKDDNVQHGHTQGAVLHPESDKRLKENRDDGESNDDKQAKYEANRKDDSVKHGHTQGAVLHPDTDMRLKENRDKAEEGKDTKTTTKDSKDDGVKHGHTQGAVLHPETDKRLKENQDGKPYQAEAGKQSHKNE